MKSTLYKLYLSFLFLIGIILTIYFAYTGFNYYSTPIEERFFDSLHESLKPSGRVGHGLGIIGSVMMLTGIFSYMIRKRVRKFGRLGILKHWLEIHIFLCSVGPILILYHTAFKFGGIVAVSFWSMVAVALSGVIGRFIYVQIPRSIQGKEFTIDELNRQNDELSVELGENYHVDENILLRIDRLASSDKARDVSFLGSFWIIAKDHFENQKHLKSLKQDLISSSISKPGVKNILTLCKSKLVLKRRIDLLKTMQRLFKYWHIIHLPFAIIMLIIMFIHIIISILFGYKWIF